MDDDERPRARGPNATFGAASLLAGESLDSYSRDELDERVALLEAEIARVRTHGEKYDARRQAAELLFRPGKP